MRERTTQEEAYLARLEEETRGHITIREIDYLRLLELRSNPDRDTLPGEREEIEFRLGYCSP
jgi:hypothetical protein